MNSKPISTEIFFYGLAFLLAAAIRLIGLGVMPLSDGEAQWALQALELSRGAHPLIGSEPGYVVLTGGLFFVLGTSSFLARILPAVMGTLLVLAPYFVREKIGQKAALVLAFGIALEPSLVAASRQADGQMLAVTGLVFAMIFLVKGQYPWSGAAFGVALLGGSSIWGGILALLLTLAITRLEPGQEQIQAGDPSMRKVLLRWCLGAVLFLGTLFFFAPGGLSGLAASMAAFVSGWVSGSGSPVRVLLIAWIISPLVFFSGWGGVIASLRSRGWLDRFLLTWWVVQFGLVLVYPAREAVDLVWMIVPFMAMGARWIVGYISLVENKKTVLAYACLAGVLLISVALNFVGLSSAISPEEELVRWGGIGAGVLLILASFFLIAWGWSWNVASKGFVYGAGSVLFLFTLMSSWSAAGLGTRPETELWVRGAYPIDDQLTMKVLGDVSEWQSGRRDSLELEVIDITQPSLSWALRDYRSVTYSPRLALDAQPALVITTATQGNNLGLSRPYTGQMIRWSQKIYWEALQANEWTRWLFYRELPNREGLLQKQTLVLWVRSDLFLGAVKSRD